MKSYNNIKGTRVRSSIRLLLLMLLLLSFSKAESQIVIGGNVYGGGNAGNTDGSSSVTVYAGDINAVFGGARKADVKGNAFVHIDGEHASDYIVINKVYGGNDISGAISGSNAEVPKELTEVIKDGMTDAQKQGKNAVDNTWNAFLRISTKLDANVMAKRPPMPRRFILASSSVAVMATMTILQMVVLIRD